jgi:hypothetical protein
VTAGVVRRALARRRKGAVALLAVAAMIPITGMLSASMNAGQMIDDRRQVQDASDSLALMHQTWAARSLNMISVNNVTTAQLLTVAVGSEALSGALIEQQIAIGRALGHINTHSNTYCVPGFPYDPWPGICRGIHGAATIPALIAQVRAAIVFFRYDPLHGINTSRDALEAIEGMNEAIVRRFPRAMAEIGRDYADELGIDDFHFADPCDPAGGATCASGPTRDGMDLPLEEGGIPARLQLCAAMERGTVAGRFTSFAERGFPDGEGPMADAGGRDGPDVMEHINDTTRVGRMLFEFKRYYSTNSPIVPYFPFVGSSLPRYYVFAGFTPHPAADNLQGEQRRAGPNSFTRKFEGKWRSICAGADLLAPSINLFGASPIIEAPVPTMWQLSGINPLNPLPPVTPEDMPEPFHALALVQKDKSRRLSAAVLTDQVESHFGYGQAGLYNPDGADLFSAAWRTKLVPAARADAPADLARGLSDRAPAAFRPLARALEPVADTASWERVNAH